LGQILSPRDDLLLLEEEKQKNLSRQNVDDDA